MHNYTHWKPYFTLEEWEKFEKNMTDRKPSKRKVYGEPWGKKQGLKKYQRHTIVEYIDDCFPWEETEEGRKYWVDLQQTLKERYDSA